MANNMTASDVHEDDKIKVFFHFGIPPKEFSTNDQTDLTCEIVLQRCIQYIQDKVCRPEKSGQIYGPKYLPAFGLTVCPKEVIWVPLNHTFKKSTEKQRWYKFRVRFRPPADQLNDSVMCEYLFLQILDDFLMGSLGKDVRLESKTLFQLLLIAIMIPRTLPLDSATLVDKNFKPRNFNITNFTKCFSKEISRKFITQPIVDHYWVYKTLKEKIREFQKHDPPAPLGFYKTEFYRLLMETVPSYCFEVYRVPIVSEEKVEDVDVALSLYKENNNEDALCYGHQFMCRLRDICGIELEAPKQLTDKRCRVTIILKKKPPEILLFAKEKAAESFITMIQGYYSLHVRYDTCLCIKYQTTGSKISQELKSFGPVGKLTIGGYLEDSKSISDSNNGGYLIHESLSQFDQYEVVCWSKFNQLDSPADGVKEKKPLKSGIIKRLEGRQLRLEMDKKEVTFANCSDLRKHLTKEYGQQIFPKDSFSTLADINEDYQVDLEYGGSFFRSEEVQNSSFALPVSKDDFLEMDLIEDKNPLVKKYEVFFNSKQMMLVQLQSEKGAHTKSFREGLQKLYALNHVSSECFLKFYNLVLDAQFSVLMEYVPLKDLLTYICETPQKVEQKVEIMNQIVSILVMLHDSNIFHGNLRLRKFMTFPGQNPGSVKIKLGDPGISSYFDTLPLEHKDNIDRLPWLSPNRRSDLKKITYESEIYAIGTTFCELLYRNDQFHEELKLGSSQNMLGYLSEHKHLPQPPFLADACVESSAEDVEGNNLVPEAKNVLDMVWKNIILKCWDEDEAERPRIQVLLNLMTDVKEQAQTIEGDTVFEKVKAVLYDFDIEMETLKTSGRPITLKQLEDKFHSVQRERFLKGECIRMNGYSELLGSGNYGAVWKGQMRIPQKDLQVQSHPALATDFPIPVAVKRIKHIPGSDRRSLFKEVITASELNHPNIVKLLYLSIDRSNSLLSVKESCPPEKYNPLMLIMEYMNVGSLINYVSKYGYLNTPERVTHILRLLLDVAEGMVYLSGKGIVHRDLAARNILLAMNESGVVKAKISDFGLARVMEENYRFYKLKTGEPLPIAWMPMECLVIDESTGKFSSEGDVWSFSTVIWETFSKGDSPRNAIAKELKVKEVRDPNKVFNLYNRGWRLPKNNFMSPTLYTLMLRCWESEQRSRPPFVELVQILKCLLSTAT